MENSARTQQFPLTAGIGFIAGALFTWIVGELDGARYVIELLSIGPIEIPFVAAAAVLSRKYTWTVGLAYVITGMVASVLMLFPTVSITSVIFLKTAVMGLIIGETAWFASGFKMRLSSVSFPGIVLACIIGIPLIFNGVPAETLDEIRQESLEMYETFMSDDNALRAIDNAMPFFKGFFRFSFGILFLGSFIISWLSFHFSRWILGRLEADQAETVPPIYTFTVPFHGIWLFITGLVFYLIEYKPVLPVAINVLFIMAGLYCIQGLAIVFYHMKRISVGIWPRIFFWLIFFVTITFSAFILIITGILDNWINLRSIPLTTDNTEQEEKDCGNENNSER